MKLTASNVDAVFTDCLFKDVEDTSNAVLAEGVTSKFGFHPGRLGGHRQDIEAMLAELPKEFKSNSGGGWSFLNACMNSHGEQWGEHRNIEQLLVLAIATAQAEYLLPREAWAMLPGGMPYFVIL